MLSLALDTHTFFVSYRCSGSTLYLIFNGYRQDTGFYLFRTHHRYLISILLLSIYKCRILISVAKKDKQKYSTISVYTYMS